MNSFDWQWWQFFLEIAEHGSLSKAASGLKISQPTLSRHLVAMEKELGHLLFERSSQGLTLTPFAGSLVEEGKVMQSSARRLQRISQGQDKQLQGRVRLSVNEMMAQYYIPILLPKFMQLYPEVFVEVEVTNKASSIDKRDADIAIRMFKPRQLDLIAQYLNELELGLFASKTYLRNNGTPKTVKQLFDEKHCLLGFDRDQKFIEGGRQLGFDIKNEQFSFRSDSIALQFELAKQNAGIVATHKNLAIKQGLQLLAIDIKLPSLPIYLVCHRDIHHNPRIRVMMSYLAKNLPPLFASVPGRY